MLVGGCYGYDKENHDKRHACAAVEWGTCRHLSPGDLSARGLAPVFVYFLMIADLADDTFDVVTMKSSRNSRKFRPRACLGRASVLHELAKDEGIGNSI